MNTRKGSATAALLAKATSQLRGDRVVTHTEEDDLKKYINSLTNKTSKQQNATSFDADSDISISNEDRRYDSQPIKSPVVSKFMKKKPAPADSNVENDARKSDANNINTSSTTKHSSTTRQSYNKQQNFSKQNYNKQQNYEAKKSDNKQTYDPKQSSKNNQIHPNTQQFHSPVKSTKTPGLTKAEALLTSKKSTDKYIPSKNFSSVSGTPMSSMSLSDMDSELSMREGRGHRRSVRPASVMSQSDDSLKVGKDGGRFLKPKSSVQESMENVIDVEVPKQEPVAKTRKLSSAFILSSDEESMAEFIGRLSDSKSHDAKPSNRYRSPSPKSYSSADDFKGNVVLDLDALEPALPLDNSTSQSKTVSQSPFYKKTASVDSVDYAHTNKQTASVFKSSAKSPFFKNENKDKPQETNETNKVNLFTSTKSPFFKQTEKSPTKSPFAVQRNTEKQSVSNKTTTKPNKQNKITKKPSTDDIFSAFGLQTVDDLMGVQSDVESVSEVYKPKNESISEMISRRSVASIPEQVKTYTEDFENSITEHIGDARSITERHKSASESETESDSSTDKSSSSSYDSDSSDSSQSHHASRVVETHTKVTMETRAIEVQTDQDSGLRYTWDPRYGQSIAGPRLGLDSVDPTPIATHVVSADALEAMTAYTPAAIALHNMLKDQLHLTTQFLEAQRSLYHAYTSSDNTVGYRYTTLEDTKEYIRTHRKPRLTFDEALKMVVAENS